MTTDASENRGEDETDPEVQENPKTSAPEHPETFIGAGEPGLGFEAIPGDFTSQGEKKDDDHPA